MIWLITIPLPDLFSLEARRASGGLTRSSGNKIKETVDLNNFLADSPTVNDNNLNPVNVDKLDSSDDKTIIDSPFGGL